MISSKLMLIAVGAGVVNALPVLTVPDAQEDRLVDLDSPAPAPSPSICQSPVGMGSMPDSIWKQLPAHPSCAYAGHPFKSEGFGQCAGDPTSITLNMGVVAEKQGCYAYTTEDKKEWTMNEVSEISFDAEWEDCEGVWTAPLWLTPKTWVAPQGLSGEIDLIETCKSHAQETVGTSIICTDHPDPQCLDSQWGEAASSNGPQRFRGKIDGEGTWTMDKCSLDGTKCELVSRYPRYLTTATGPEKDMKFHFVSDLWNGGAGDSGWAACGTLNKNTKCRYTIANIKVTPKGEATP